MAYAVAKACSGRVVAGVKVVCLHILHVAHGINKTIRWVHGDGHQAPIVVDREVEGMPLARVTPGFKGVMCSFQVDLYVGHEVENLFWGMEAGLNVVDYESYIDVGDLLMLVICLEDKENGCSPLCLRVPSTMEGINAPSMMSFHR